MRRIPSPHPCSGVPAGLIALLFTLAPVSAAPAQEPTAGGRTLQSMPAGEAVRVDGVLDEAAWLAAPAASGFTQQSPRPGAPSDFRTEVRVLVDAGALYVGIRAFDTAPDSIVARLARRDVEVHSDWLHVALDSYGDRRSAYQFGVNAAGVKRDARISDDTREDVAWDGVWDAAVRIGADGWTAELRIPLAQLRYRTAADAPAWRINVKRVVARAAEVSFWAPVPVSAASYVSSFGELAGVRPLRAPRRIELMPYFASRVQHDGAYAGDPYRGVTAADVNAGADLRLNVAPAFTLMAAINPDFAQVEQDPSRVNLTAYEIFLPERRPFFVDGAEHFRVNGPTLFYSRRIGRAPQGSVSGDFVDLPAQATLLGAAKLTGRAGAWSIGVLDAVTAREHARYRVAGEEHTALVEPATNYAVARIARDFREGRTGIAAIATATHRALGSGELPQLRSAAYAGGLDARHRFAGGRYEVAATFLASHVRGDTMAIARTQRAAGHYFQRPDATHLRYEPERRSLSGSSLHARAAKVAGGSWRAGVAAELTSPAFEVNDLGFFNGADRMSQNAWLRYLRAEPGRLFRRWSISAWQGSEFTTGGERIDATGTADVSATLHNHWEVSLWGMRHLGGLLPDALRGGPALFHPGRWMTSVDVTTDRRRALSGTIGYFTDRAANGDDARLNLFAALHVRPSARLDLSVQPSAGRFRTDAQYVGQRRVDADTVFLLGTMEQRTLSASVRLNYTFTPSVSLQLYAQPYVSSASFAAFTRVGSAPRSPDARLRLRPFDERAITRAVDARGVATYSVDEDGDGVAELTWVDPSFSFRQLRSSAVLRWEFRPASTFFLVWTQERTDDEPAAGFDARRDALRMLRARGPNALMLKVSYWLGG